MIGGSQHRRVRAYQSQVCIAYLLPPKVLSFYSAIELVQLGRLGLDEWSLPRTIGLRPMTLLFHIETEAVNR